MNAYVYIYIYTYIHIDHIVLYVYWSYTSKYVWVSISLLVSMVGFPRITWHQVVNQLLEEKLQEQVVKCLRFWRCEWLFNLNRPFPILPYMALKKSHPQLAVFCFFFSLDDIFLNRSPREHQWVDKKRENLNRKPSIFPWHLLKYGIFF